MPVVTESAAWLALQSHEQIIADLHLRDLFEADPSRFDRYSINLDDILFDYSKNRITDDTLPLLLKLADDAQLKQKIAAMFSGEKINVTESRAVLHTALRNRANTPVMVDGRDVMPDINRVLKQMREFSERVRSHAWRGYTGKPITDIVNIGIGGSDLGPKMVVKALTPYIQPGLRAHFVSNIDENDLLNNLRTLDQETTLFIVASKTFSTQETMANAHSARDWLLSKAPDETAIAKHFVAVSTNAERVHDFGIDTSHMFEFWDWVGGRYSMWSAIGLPIAVMIGMNHFEELLTGAERVDQHFRTADFDKNIPVIMGLLGIWYNNFMGAETHAVLPYDQNLEYLTDYLQQADMESNGKSVDINAQPISYSTGPIIFGEPGTNGQHAFYQLLHQGSKLVPCDFLAAAQSHHHVGDHHAILVSNFLAQTEALMMGRTTEEARRELEKQGVAPSKVDALARAKTFIGNKPSNSFLYRKLSPQTLGSLIALYEHKIYVQGVIWNINSFDQMGVELGKHLARKILPQLDDDQPVGDHDSSTNGLLNYYKSIR
ncbi:glucose-6-phosphate isomerase [Candidatus Methylospira mobilis]|uniref:glucose-6-phosphate isomerase n=1 Tax=Candidatus Methylospira mobilis TaxID=1808979 RepID=UPI0028EC9D94|nr:glucose-6-phosphate isomerase [Candidatus Methylospira mobilis]WNV06102.1 glucose-6-phosphate isomerase [Candidatus Methylospira mobilis]